MKMLVGRGGGNIFLLPNICLPFTWFSFFNRLDDTACGKNLKHVLRDQKCFSQGKFEFCLCLPSGQFLAAKQPLRTTMGKSVSIRGSLSVSISAFLEAAWAPVAQSAHHIICIYHIYI